jgi:hypothetical protein
MSLKRLILIANVLLARLAPTNGIAAVAAGSPE